ncbi:potassium channel subfamily K member 16-like [Chanos chanos]|uniref:2P domain potassium channel Talk-1 n=1 Tax=Chanos chanos TaxID=29144 RepID=A0A6J2WG51_CHACN|nr:potassium channel subfamily K member 16-like [Chanos chanos]
MGPKHSASKRAPKRQKKVKTLQEQVELLDMLRAAKSAAAVARHYGVAKSTTPVQALAEMDNLQKWRLILPRAFGFMAWIQKMTVSWTALLTLSYFTYLLLGATIFQLLEREAESNNRNHFQLEKLNFLANYTCLDRPALEKFVTVILDAWENGVNPSGNSTNPSNWDFSSSFFFAGTVVTTIGYGNLSPSTMSGQVFCVFYALFGIPLNLAFLNHLSKCLTLHLQRLERGVISAVPRKKFAEVLVVGLFLITGSVLFLVIPPLTFSYVEGWTYCEAFYYAFITLSTIGFGDYVVGTDPDKQYITVYRSLAGVWIIFGLVWLALILNVGTKVMENILALKEPSTNVTDEIKLPYRRKEEEGCQKAVQRV